MEVEPLTPTNPELATSIANMQDRGIGIMYGRWLIEGAPRIILIDTKTGYQWLDEWKADLWATAGIPSPPGDDETNEAVVFGYLVAWFLGEVLWCGAGTGDKLTDEQTVCLPRAEESHHCPLPRMARGSSASPDEEKEN